MIARPSCRKSCRKTGTQPVEYILTKEEGPDHNKSFTVEARVNGKVMGRGSGIQRKQQNRPQHTRRFVYSENKQENYVFKEYRGTGI